MDRGTPSSPQPSSPTTLAARPLNVDIPEAVAKSLGIPRDAAVQTVADQLRTTGGIVFEVDANGLSGIHAILTVYAGIGDARIVVSNTRIGDLGASRSQDWVDILEQGASVKLDGLDGRCCLVFYLTREDGFMVKASLTGIGPDHKPCVFLPYEGGVKIVRAIIDILVKYGH
jgi:hypothetical protein